MVRWANEVGDSDDGASYDLQAALFAWDLDNVAAAQGGTFVIYGCDVTVHTGGTAVDVAAGRVSVDGVEVNVSAQSNIAVSAEDSTNLRIDTVTISSAGTASVNTGTAAPQPVPKSLPKNSFGVPNVVPLYVIPRNATGATTIVAGQLTDRRYIIKNRPLASGWVCDDNTWTVTVASAAGTAASGASNGVADTQGVFTVPGDYRSRYMKGTRLRWIVSGVARYGVVQSAAFASSTTTVTLMPMSNTTTGSNIVLPTSGIDTGGVFYSHAACPEGFPDWFGYNPVYTGFSAYGGCFSSWAVQGNKIVVNIETFGAFTSSAAAHSLTAPATNPNLTGIKGCAMYFAQDNGTTLPTPGVVTVGQNTATFSIFPSASAGSWSSSGTTQFHFTITYEF